MRLCACMNIPLNIIEPCGFPWDERKFKRAGLDYMAYVQYTRHSSWDAFLQAKGQNRLILMTTHGTTPYTDFTFEDSDILLAGSESKGAPDHVHEKAYARICIPMHANLRSLNIVNATSMIIGEVIRQVRL